MNESTKTKKALRGSLFALFLCIVLLIGTTFAWFTDTASTGVNKIQAGNLDVGLQMQDNEDNWVSAEGETLTFKAKDGRAAEEILWEPGCTYELPKLRVVNNGNLALKYKIKITGIQGSEKLNEVIDWTMNGVDINTEQHLKAGEESAAMTLQGHMQESAGNEYQGLSIDGISITVYATQDTVENDSFNNQYDANATSADELKAALKNGGDINISKNIYTDNTDSIDARMIISKPTTLNLDKKIISPDNMGNNQTNFTALIVSADTTINASDEGGIDTGTNGGYGINVKNGAKLTINGGYYYGGGTAVQVQSGTAIINGGTFACEPYSDPTYGYNFLMNCIDSAYKDGTAKIIIKGGTFINFNPADCKAEGAGTNFVAEGYKVVSEAHGSDTWYKVVKE
ncbi:MAG: SipW-dependent-type signal peptide-containing protein [Clostridia bacterium]